MSQKQELLKIIKKETKELNKMLSYDEQQEQLVLKISNKDFKEALKIDPDTKQLTDHFTDSYKLKLNQIRKYNVVDAESFKLEFDPKCDNAKKQLYLIAWNRYFATSIITHTKDHKALKKKMIWYLIAGILTIFIFTAIQIIAVINKDNTTIQIVAVCFEWLLILAWVFCWDFVEILISDLPASKAKLVDLYLMYKGNGEFSKSNTKSTNTVANQATITIQVPIDKKMSPHEIKTKVEESIKKEAK